MSSEDKQDESVDLDTAITMSGLGKFHIGLAIVSGGCIAAATADTLGNGFLLPNVACELELSAANKGLYSGATFLGMVITTYGWGFASDTFGRRGVLLKSMGIAWLASFCSSLAPVFWLLVLLRFLTGAASAAMASTVFAYMAEFFPSKQRTKYLSWTGVFVGLVYCLMPAAAWLILPLTWTLDLKFVVVTSWRMLSILNGFFILVSFLGMLGLPESPKYLVSVDKHNEAIEVLGKIFSINTGRPANKFGVQTIRNTAEDIRTVAIEAHGKLSLLNILKTMKDQVVPIFGRKHLHSTILACALQFCIFSSSCGFYLWLPDIQNRMMSYNVVNPNSTATVCDAISIRPAPASNVTCHSEINPTVYMSALWTGAYYFVGYLMVAILLNFVGKRTLLVTMQLTSGIAGFGLYWATDLTLVTIFSTVYIVQSGACSIPLSLMISDLYPTHLRSAALCIAMTVGRFGSSLTGAVIGIFMEYDCTLTIVGLGLLSIGNGLLILLIPQPAKTIDPIGEKKSEVIPR